MNNIILPSDPWTSLRTAFNLSSNSPLYFAPAINAPISRENIILSFRPSGTSPLTILSANPSTIAVLPTPGSPIKTGLFLVLLDNILITRLISSSLPITGSSLFFLANSTKFVPYFASASYVPSGSWVSTLWFPLTWWSTPKNASLVIPKSFNILPVAVFFSSSIIASITCSTLIYESLKSFEISSAFKSTSFILLVAVTPWDWAPSP